MFNGNKVFIVDKKGNRKRYFGIIPGLNIRFKGKNSVVEIHEPLPKFSKCKIRIKNNTFVSIGFSKYKIKKLEINGESNQNFVIGNNFSTYGCELVTASENNLQISIGSNCMFAKNIIIRASDGHSIVSNITDNIINYGKNISIGNNVWIAGNATILKGVTVGDNSVIGHGSIVTKNCDSNSVYVGNPAKKVKSEIKWERPAPFQYDFNKPIDIVYLWVNSNDKIWQSKKKLLEQKLGRNSSEDDRCRYLDNDELKYALRSLEKYVPWINNVYIVTDNQVPEWLNLNHPKLHIVDHTKLIPTKFLPSFNSNAIIHSISNIEGLSEYFLYSDDDAFFLDKVEPNFFYAEDGYPIFRYGKKYTEKDTDEWHQMIRNADSLLLQKFGKIFRNISHHSIDAYRLSDILDCQKCFNSEIKETISHQFRMDSDIERIIYSKYACFIGHGHRKLLYKRFNFIYEFWNYIRNKSLKDTIVLFPQSRHKLNKINKIKPKCMCINDSENTTDLDRQNMKLILEHLYPQASKYEK